MSVAIPIDASTQTVNLPAGERGSEYGGVPVAAGGPYLAVGSSVYMRVAYYF